MNVFGFLCRWLDHSWRIMLLPWEAADDGYDNVRQCKRCKLAQWHHHDTGRWVVLRSTHNPEGK